MHFPNCDAPFASGLRISSIGSINIGFQFNEHENENGVERIKS
jgi:hypothetical protein